MTEKRPENALVRTVTIGLRVLALSAFVFAGFAAWSAQRLPVSGTSSAAVETAGALVLAAGLLALSLLPAHTRLGASISALILGAGFVAIDTYLGRVDVMMPDVAKARRLGVQFDDRLVTEVVLEGRARGESLMLPVFPADYRSEFGSDVVFSHAARARVVLCNELGSYEVIDTDDYGFNNPRGAWGHTKTDVMIVGDSFAEGFCVPREARLAEIVRQRYPLTVNLGRGGLGPLGELSILREYAPVLQPRAIVWCFFDNDLSDLRTEIQIPTLMRYLHEPEFTQNLHGRRDEVNQRVKHLLEGRIEVLGSRYDLPFRGTRRVVNHWVPKVRALGESRLTSGGNDDREHIRQQFRAVMMDALRVTRSLGAELIFVHLRDLRSPGLPAAETIDDIVAQLGLPVVDIADGVRGRFADPREMHRLTANHPLEAPGNLIGHYNSDGHRLAGEMIVAAIEAQLELAKRPGRPTGIGTAD
jgi:hypothetical protein